MAPIWSIKDITKAHGQLILLKDQRKYFDFGFVGGGTWFNLRTQVDILNSGAQYRDDLCQGVYDNKGFFWGRMAELFINVGRRHTNCKWSVWRLNTDKSLYYRATLRPEGGIKWVGKARCRRRR